MNEKIELIKKDFKVNDYIKITRNDCKEFEGTIVEFGYLYVKLKTSAGIVTIFDNLIGGWEFASAPKITSSVEDDLDHFRSFSISDGDKKNIEVTQDNKDNFSDNYLKDFISFCEIVEKSELNFNNFKFDFKLKDLEKISVSEDFKQIQKQLVDLKNKYDYAIKVKENIRLKDILISLQILLQNNYFDNDIRYNIAFIYYKLGEKNKAEETLKEAINIDRKSSVLYFLCTLYYDQNNLLETSFYLNEILKDTSFDRNNGDFAFFTKLVQECQCYELLDGLFQYKLEKNFKYEIEAIIYATAYLLKSNNFEKDAFAVINKFLTNKGNAAYIKEAFHNTIPFLTAKPRNQVTKFLSEKFDIKKNRLVPANAEVYDYNIQQQYGNLRFSVKAKGLSAIASFYLKDILDENLKIKLSSFKGGNTIQVVCNIKPINKFQNSAYNIQIPKDAKVILDLADNFIKQKKYELAEGLASQVLQTYPDDQTAIELKTRTSEFFVTESVQSDSKRVVVKKYIGSNYSKADQARKDKDWDTAIVYFKKAIENNENTESAIKDVASIYQQQGNISEAIKLVEDNFRRFTNKEAVYNFISNLYIATKDYKNAIKSLSNLSNFQSSKKRDTKKSIDIKKRLAYCYLKDGEYVSAKRLLKEILKKSSDDASAKKWLDVLIEAEKSGTYEKIDTLFKESDFLILSGGLSPIIECALQKCDFAGIPATVIAKGDFFNQKTLNSLRDQIHRVGKTRHQDKARYLLTEAKLMQGIDIGDEHQIKTVLARYCTAMALSCAASNYPSDIVRSYYLECFSFENDWFYLEMQVSNYLQSFNLTGEKLVLAYDNKPSIEKSIREIFESDNKNKFLWDGILEMFITNTVITAQALARIYKNEKARKSALDFLSIYQITVTDNITEEHFKDKWNEAREKRKREFEYWFNTVGSLTNTTSLEGLLTKIDTSLQESRKNWLQQTDTHRLDKVSDIVSTMKQYQVQTAFDEKERLFGIALTQIEKLLQEIEDRPTRFSFEGFRPLLQRTKDLLNQSFGNVLKASTPKISIALLGEFVCDHNNQINIQVAVRNDKQCSPINDIKIGIVNNENCQLVGEPAFSPETLKGGSETILKLTIRVSKSIVDEKVTDIELICSYKSRNADDETTTQSLQTLNLYPESEFESIDNIFSRVADSGAVTDKNMFKGRDAFINNIADTLINSKSKCVVIYGQKRSGKSSVLYHLKEKLKQTNRVLCIDFSLGEIITDLNIVSFYYKILSGLEDEVYSRKTDNVESPVFTCPGYHELSQNSSIIFDEKIKIFKKECQKLSRGHDRNIILMIDEFTYLYSAIMRGKVSEDFMKTWKALIEKGVFTAVLVGQDVMPKFKAKFPNEFGVTEDKRLTYLKIEDARELIEKPIWDMKRNKTRFIGKAIDRIIDYTAANPYYVQIFCARLVEYMNLKKAICATEVHVKEVAESLIKGSQALTEDKFDNLLTAGDADLESIPLKDTLDILRQIANASQNLGYCSRDSISLKRKEEDDIIIEDLLKRDVLSVKDGYYRIQVQLFQDWLLNH